MGNPFQKLFSKVLWEEGLNTPMIGLDSAGKTTILYKLKLGEIRTWIPTIGLTAETLWYKKTRLSCFDVGGSGRIYPPLETHFGNINSLIYVIDSANHESFSIEENKKQIHYFFNLEKLKSLPILIFANKQDLPNSMNPQEIIETFDLNKFRDRKWLIQPCKAILGEGLYEGFKWLVSILQTQEFENKKENEKENEK
ncbi:adp-ribosylation factor [Anaeramoeba flamelloides]|uniref:Adp-ribosylation factor n=1 Tax=Anaeramoeba flamelloides TaxID=1746091 RepID=A0AAV7ZSK2_9EUKA|nr:adp-ribosylation factor [Anaeramoeba flamelloides]